MTNSNVLGLTAVQLIDWCKERKHELGLSNQKLSDLSGVPIGTIDRILAGGYSEFRYSSIQPLVSILVGFTEATPVPEEETSEQGQYYYNTIEGYKLIVENKNHEIDNLKKVNERLLHELEFVKSENNKKQDTLDRYNIHIKWMESVISSMLNK